MSDAKRYDAPGPFRAEHVRPGDNWEISDGRPIECAPTGGDGARRSAAGARVLSTDPDVESAGLDAGYAPVADMLRAPDIAVGNVPDRPGWIPGVPPLAVEYAGVGQDENLLQRKVADFLGRGTKWIWVVRLNTPRRVEVHAPGLPVVVRHVGELLEAPGILRNAVPVEAMFDDDVANKMTLRNLLQRAGYESLEAVRNEGHAEGIAEGKAKGITEGKAKGITEGKRATLSAQLRRRFGQLTAEVEVALAAADELALDAAVLRIFDATSAAEVLGPPH